MSDDWQVGDLALCVRSGRQTRTGHIYTVDHVSPPGSNRIGDDGRTYRNSSANIHLLMAELRPHKRDVCEAPRFRKIRPHTPDAEDAETIRLLTGKPVRLPA